MCSVSSARRGACRGPARFCWCTRTRCTSTSISSRGPAWPSSTPRCSRRPAAPAPHGGRQHPRRAGEGDGAARPAHPERRRARPRHGGRVAAGAAAAPAAPHAGPGLARPLRHVDHGGRAAGPERRQLPAPVRRAGAAAAARELVVDGGREHGRRGGPGARRGRAGGPPASREDPLAWAHRGPARAAVGVARDRLRGGPGHDVQRAAPLGAPLGARGNRGALAARAAGAKPAAHGARGPGGVPPAGPGAGGGGGESRRGTLGRLPPRDAAPPQARARGRREPRLRRRTGRLRDGDRPLHLRQPADLDRDHVEPAPFRARRGGGVRGDPHGAERAGARLGSETMKRLAVLMAVCFVDLLGLMLVAPLMAFYALRLHAPEWMVGPLIASFAVAQLVSSPVWGKFSDRYGRRPAMIIGLGASAFAYLIFGFANTLWLLFASRIVQGLGGGTTGVAQAYVADTMAPAERAKALGWLSAATRAGAIPEGHVRRHRGHDRLLLPDLRDRGRGDAPLAGGMVQRTVRRGAHDADRYGAARARPRADAASRCVGSGSAGNGALHRVPDSGAGRDRAALPGVHLAGEPALRQARARPGHGRTADVSRDREHRGSGWSDARLRGAGARRSVSAGRGHRSSGGTARVPRAAGGSSGGHRLTTFRP